MMIKIKMPAKIQEDKQEVEKIIQKKLKKMLEKQKKRKNENYNTIMLNIKFIYNKIISLNFFN